jgi:hypothetical protein
VPSVANANAVLGGWNDLRTNVFLVGRAAGERKNTVDVCESVERFAKLQLAFKNIVLEISYDHELGVLDQSIQVPDIIVKERNVIVFEIGNASFLKDELEVFWQVAFDSPSMVFMKRNKKANLFI